MRHGGIALAIYAGLIVLTWFGFNAVPGGFIPEQDKQYLVAVAQLPPAASLDRTDAVTRRIADDRHSSSRASRTRWNLRACPSTVSPRARAPASSSFRSTTFNSAASRHLSAQRHRGAL